MRCIKNTRYQFRKKLVTAFAGSPVIDMKKNSWWSVDRDPNDQLEARLLMMTKIGDTDVKVSDGMSWLTQLNWRLNRFKTSTTRRLSMSQGDRRFLPTSTPWPLRRQHWLRKSDQESISWARDHLSFSPCSISSVHVLGTRQSHAPESTYSCEEVSP